MTPPLPGMTVRPYGEDYMASAFVAMLMHIGKDPMAVQAFEKDHPNLVISPAKNAIEAAIDKAAGVNAEIGAKFADWVAINIWGVE